MSSKDKPTFAIVLQDVPGWDVPVINRLRRFLKAALRAYGLRCVEIKETTCSHESVAENSNNNYRSVR